MKNIAYKFGLWDFVTAVGVITYLCVGYFIDTKNFACPLVVVLFLGVLMGCINSVDTDQDELKRSGLMMCLYWCVVLFTCSFINSMPVLASGSSQIMSIDFKNIMLSFGSSALAYIIVAGSLYLTRANSAHQFMLSSMLSLLFLMGVSSGNLSSYFHSSVEIIASK